MRHTAAFSRTPAQREGLDSGGAIQYRSFSEGHRLSPQAIALLQRAELYGLLPAGVGHAAADAYRELRRAQHRARLDEQPTQVDPEAMAEQRDAVLALWRAVFGSAGP